MFNFISLIYAADAPSKGMATLMQLAPFFLIFVIFYFLIIRPQRKKQLEHKKMVEALKVGDIVVLSSGFKGSIAKINDKDFIAVEIASNTVVDVLRSSIVSVVK